MKWATKVLLPDKGKPSARTGRKATGLSEPAGLPKDSCHARHVGSTEPPLDPTQRSTGGRRRAHEDLYPILPAAAVAAGLLVAAPRRRREDQERRTKTVMAKIALGDKRPVKAKAAPRPRSRSRPRSPRRVHEHRRACRPPRTSSWSAPRSCACTTRSASQAGLPPLKDNAKLRKAAVGHSNDMVAEGYFDHTSPDGDTFVDRILGAGYAKRNDGWTLGENLAWGTGDLSTAAGRHERLDELRRPQGQHPQEGLPRSRHRHPPRRPDRQRRRRHRSPPTSAPSSSAES